MNDKRTEKPEIIYLEPDRWLQLLVTKQLERSGYSVIKVCDQAELGTRRFTPRAVLLITDPQTEVFWPHKTVFINKKIVNSWLEFEQALEASLD